MKHIPIYLCYLFVVVILFTSCEDHSKEIEKELDSFMEDYLYAHTDEGFMKFLGFENEDSLRKFREIQIKQQYGKCFDRAFHPKLSDEEIERLANRFLLAWFHEHYTEIAKQYVVYQKLKKEP